MKKFMRLERIAFGMVMLVGLVAATASAAPMTTMTLQDLINTGSTGITVGDKQFYDFTYVPSGTVPTNPIPPNPNPAAPNASQINVTPITSPNIGLQFAFGWNSSHGYIMDSLIGYKIHVLAGNPQQVIDQVGLSFNGAVPIPGNGTFASVTETVRDLSGNILGQTSVHADSSNNLLQNTVFLAPPQRDIQVQKDIMVSSYPTSLGGTTSTISFVDNTYHQIPVPEPAGLAVLALAGLCALRRRSS